MTRPALNVLAWLVCFGAVSLLNGGSQDQRAQDLGEQYRSIQASIAANHYDSLGATEAGLRTAVRDLEELVGAGFEIAEARRLLADSYHEIAVVYSPRDSAERERLLALHATIYDDLLTANPSSVDLLYAYSLSASAEGAQLQASERLIPKAMMILADASANAGGWLLESNAPDDYERGFQLLGEAFEWAVGMRKVSIGRQLENALRAAGRSEEASEISNQVQIYERDLR